MPERTPYIAANWKMHKTVAEAAEFVDALLPRIAATQHDVVICPPFLALSEVVERSRGSAVRVAAQNMHEERGGRLHRRGLGADAGRDRRRRGDPRPLRAPPALRRDRRGAGAQGARPRSPPASSRSSASARARRRATRARPRRCSERQLQADLAAVEPAGLGRGRGRLRADLGDRHRPHRDPRAGPGGDRLHPRRPARLGAPRPRRCGSSTAARSSPTTPPSCWPSPTSTAPWSAAPASTRASSRRSSRPPDERDGCRLPRWRWSSSTAGAWPSPAPATRSPWPRRRSSTASGTRYPHTQLSAQGRDVGLPDGQMGNSEVGHLNLGAGAIVKQDLARIDDAIADGSFFENEALLAACERARHSPRGRLHLLGLVSDGGVHSGWEHIEAMHRAGLPGGRARRRLPRLHRRPRHAAPRRPRATSPSSSAGCATPAGSPPSAAATTRWIATPAGSGPSSPTTRSSTPRGQRAASSEEAIAASYERGETDEFVKPTVIGDYDGAAAGDVAIFVNFRPDRAREMTRALAEPDFDEFSRAGGPLLELTTMTEYRKGWPYPVAFPEARPKTTLAETIAEAGGRQLHVAETEKYAHVTYFFNGGREEEWDGEERSLVDSPRDVPTYDYKPEMSARGGRRGLRRALVQRRLPVRDHQLRQPRHGRPHRGDPGRGGGGRGGRRLPGRRRRGGGGQRRRLHHHRRPRQLRPHARARRLAQHRALAEPGAADRHRRGG